MAQRARTDRAPDSFGSPSAYGVAQRLAFSPPHKIRDCELQSWLSNISSRLQNLNTPSKDDVTPSAACDLIKVSPYVLKGISLQLRALKHECSALRQRLTDLSATVEVAQDGALDRIAQHIANRTETEKCDQSCEPAFSTDSADLPVPSDWVKVVYYSHQPTGFSSWIHPSLIQPQTVNASVVTQDLPVRKEETSWSVHDDIANRVLSEEVSTIPHQCEVNDAPKEGVEVNEAGTEDIETNLDNEVALELPTTITNLQLDDVLNDEKGWDLELSEDEGSSREDAPVYFVKGPSPRTATGSPTEALVSPNSSICSDSNDAEELATSPNVAPLKLPDDRTGTPDSADTMPIPSQPNSSCSSSENLTGSSDVRGLQTHVAKKTKRSFGALLGRIWRKNNEHQIILPSEDEDSAYCYDESTGVYTFKGDDGDTEEQSRIMAAVLAGPPKFSDAQWTENPIGAISAAKYVDPFN